MPLFSRIELETTQIEPQRAFYSGSLELELVESGEGSFAVRCGQTVLSFSQVDASQPRQYHFAIDIPTNKLEESLDWARSRFAVNLKEDGSAIYSFDSWNAQAFYFLDPEGNILEFITRRNSPSQVQEPFTSKHIRYISELGVVTEDVVKTCLNLQAELKLPCFPDPNVEPNPDFQPMGTDDGLFIVAKFGRSWLGGTGTAQPFPSKTSLSIPQKLTLTDTLCTINP